MWAWISGAPVRAGWACDGGDQLSFYGALPRGVQGATDGSRKIKWKQFMSSPAVGGR